MKIVDLSQTIYSGMNVHPGDPKVEVARTGSYEVAGWIVRRITLGSHTGTHVDAFSHMDEDGEPLDQIPLERFFGPARLVVPGGSYPKNVGLIFYEDPGIDSLEPILSANPPFVAGTICENLERALLKKKIVTYTDLANLDQLPLDRDFMFYGFPLKIKDGDGSPVRAVAIIEE